MKDVGLYINKSYIILIIKYLEILLGVRGGLCNPSYWNGGI